MQTEINIRETFQNFFQNAIMVPLPEGFFSTNTDGSLINAAHEAYFTILP